MRYRLLQARLPGDVVRAEEHHAFASRLGVDPSLLVSHDLLHDELSYAAVTEGVDALLVGGSGAFGMKDRAEHDWINGFVGLFGEVCDRGFPTFASCFGFQGIVVALGGEVLPDDDSAEVGSFQCRPLPAAKSDPLFGALPELFWTQLGHKDRAMVFPDGALNLAASERCPYQALRVPGKPVYATQFHPELTDADNKQRFSRYYDMYAQVFGDGEAERMIREGFRPSPESNDLLKRFASLLAAGELG